MYNYYALRVCYQTHNIANIQVRQSTIIMNMCVHMSVLA